MIVSDLEHIESQIQSNNALKKAVEFLRRLEADVPVPEEGRKGRRIDIDGQNMFAIVRRYKTVVMDEPIFEYHKKYVDVQYIVSGEEIIGWAPVGSLPDQSLPDQSLIVTQEYNEEKDICTGTVSGGRISYIYLQAGRVAVFYPDDGHAPGLAAGAPSSVCKVVVKIAVGQDDAKMSP
jgi:YhcH/YjgK/YiaL family protein